MFDYMLTFVCSVNRQYNIHKKEIYETLQQVHFIMNSITNYDI
jgi:hypothetical protein